MTFMAADLGGSRLKLGVLGDDGRWATETHPSPATLAALAQILSGFWHKHDADEWAICLPGKVAVDGTRWTFSRARFAVPADGMTREQFGNAVAPFGLPSPAALISDTSALAAGVIGSGSGMLLQLSTGVGSRVVLDGAVALNPFDATQVLGADMHWEFWGAPDGTVRRFWEWTGWRWMQKWLAPELVGLTFEQLAASDHPDVDLIVDAAVGWISRAHQVKPPTTPLFLGGGGALAFAQRIDERLDAAWIEGVIYAEDSIVPGLAGTAALARGAAAAS